MTFLLRNGQTLVEGAFHSIDVLAGPEGLRLEPQTTDAARVALDLSGCRVLPGIVDVHGDAFERIVEPRPGVALPLPVAFAETDRQLVANGITTAFLGVTASWEPGPRSLPAATALLDAIETARQGAAADLRIHLRHEIFNLDAEATLLGWIAERRIEVLAFNDHMSQIVKTMGEKKVKRAQMIARSGLEAEAFEALVDRVHSRADEIPASLVRLAEAARQAGIILFSHDDSSPEMRARFRQLGCRVAEFPLNAETARAAREAGEAVVFGAPNVLRGGSHTGAPSAAEMVRLGLGTILASDYVFPALAQAPFLLAEAGECGFAEGWALVSSRPATALGLEDRGTLANGKRADVTVVREVPAGLAIVATIANGRLVHLSEGQRIAAP